MIFPYLSVEENILSGMENMPDKTVPQFVYDTFPVLHEMRNRKGGNLSGGQQQQLAISRALVSNPKVLILDEPTDGLDPLQKHQVRTLIGEIAREKTIVISTHILEEVDAVCTRAIIIAKGKLVADDTPTGLKARAPSGRLEDVFRAVAA
jgi:ABC-type multidrug transport system ATPase subunit